MSGPDEADRDKGFLARWSQRKQEAKQAEPKPDTPVAESVEASDPPAAQPEDTEPEFDLSTLPKLEELTETTDITAFLRKGVPEQLRNEALRKSWALDPAIRNYVNPALDYAYDWNAPGGVPGGGELGPGVDVARLVAQIMGEPAAETVKSDANAGKDVAGSPPPDLSPESQSELPMQPVRRAEEAIVDAEVASNVEKAADGTARADESEPARTVAPQQPVRRHGTAKPIV
ncbi:hypothetical protein CQ12_02705 [Bradyrhizobium jicamae]|uniref:DUF3306 domain-containing protein n=1 Tax=Bradyrhizobium jicamae TaxID=280332 RepID=A0A0R3LE08_9BRAD|nr:DUF3306 domain-containing protein [Bradyrhizobium jicamae]KRR06056.1 hypothetical protein CQ12_02705 [Bradyrhizobium jicamae]